jgi:hypothetical protein
VPETPISGKDGKVTYGASPTTMGVTGWTYRPTANVLDVSNTSDGRLRIAGLPDATGSCNVHVNTAPEHETALAPGTTVALNLYIAPTKGYALPAVIITDVEYGIEVEGSYDATFNFAIQSGTPDYAPGTLA